MRHFIIFSLARTGSTTLLKLLNCHPDIVCAFEPFGPTNTDEFLLQCHHVRRKHGLDAALERLWTVYNGFKHVWTHAGWPFEDNPYLNQQLLLESGTRIVLLHRKNQLRRAISVQISEQMKVWTPNRPEQFLTIREHHFTPLDIPDLKREMETAHKALTWAQGHLVRSRVAWRELAYEDFLEPALPIESQVAAVQAILEFLGVPRLADAERLHTLRSLLDPATTGFQNVESYFKIPNIADVEQALGSDAVGHV